MDKPTKKCRICGKEYEACKPIYVSDNPYRWQDVACCEEHGMEYFARVAASRNVETKAEQIDSGIEDSATESEAKELAVDIQTEDEQSAKKRKKRAAE